MPKQYFNTYGTLQRIKAEWYEYKTKDIIVTNSDLFYDKMLPYIGQHVGSRYNNAIPIQFGQDMRFDSHWDNDLVWTFNAAGHNATNVESIHWLFYKDVRPINDETAWISSAMLYNWMRQYTQEFADPATLTIHDGQFSSDLFCDDIDSHRVIDNERGKIQKGYSYYDFDLDLDIRSWLGVADAELSFWDKVLEYGFHAAMGELLFDEDFFNERGREFAPFEVIKNISDLGDDGNINEIANRYYINESHVGAIRNYYDQVKDDCYLVLFHFAVTDYESHSIHGKVIDLEMNSEKQFDGYRATETIFLDFDIIDLTFNRNGRYITIPAVSSPINIIDDVVGPHRPTSSEPEAELNWPLILISGLLLLVVCLLLYRVIHFFMSSAFDLAEFPIKAVKRHRKQKASRATTNKSKHKRDNQ